MESIHPNDIITMDLNSISYLTLKNGNMILIDDSVPEKGNKENQNIPKSSIFNNNEIKLAPKKFKLQIEYPSKFFVKGIKTFNINDKYKNTFDYKKSNKIIKNESFTFRGIKMNYNYNNNIYEKEKENFQMNNNFAIEKNHKVHFKDDFNNINNKYNPTQSSRENEIEQIRTMTFNNNINIQQNNNYNNINNDNNNINNINSDYNQSKINTNMSIPISGIINNNNADNKNNNLNNNNNNMNQTSKRKNKSKIFGFFGKDKKVRISINAVCSLNIKAEDKYKINLINQFNNLVDRLNEEREKGTVNKFIENEKNEKYSKFYPLYKNKTHNDVIKKNFDMMNQNYNLDFNSEMKNNIIGNKTSNNFYKKDNFEYNKLNFNLMLNQNSSRRLSSQSSSEIEKLKCKIQRFSTGIVRPSNKLFNI